MLIGPATWIPNWKGVMYSFVIYFAHTPDITCIQYET